MSKNWFIVRKCGEELERHPLKLYSTDILKKRGTEKSLNFSQWLWSNSYS